jgi:glycosyltransferase involved in cell wall biosynthesis
MSRAAFLPSPGDPFVLLHCIKYFKDVWYDEVDKLYICINSDIEKDVIFKLLDLLKDPKIVVSYFDRTLGHGKALNMMLEQCSEDNILLIEDDSIVFKKGIVDEYFKKIESKEYELIGSPRMSCTPEHADWMKKTFKLNYEGWGDKGPSFWPCFFWISKSLLNQTGKEFGNSIYGDTFVRTSFHLRALLDDRQDLALEIPQYHCSPDDYINAGEYRGIFDGRCGYMHFGSLSSGIENTLLTDRGIPLKERTKPGIQPVNIRHPQTEQEKAEFIRRIVWWNEAYRLNQTEFGQFGDAYGEAIENIIRTCGFNWSDINTMRKMYMEVING